MKQGLQEEQEEVGRRSQGGGVCGGRDVGGVDDWGGAEGSGSPLGEDEYGGGNGNEDGGVPLLQGNPYARVEVQNRVVNGEVVPDLFLDSLMVAHLSSSPCLPLPWYNDCFHWNPYVCSGCYPHPP